MVNEEHLARLRAGVGAWNAWRKEHPDIAPDLHGADLRWANLSDANLRDANLRDANLHRANLRDANLHRADLSWADLTRADLRGTNLHEAHSLSKNLGDADLREANLSGANLSEADLRGATLHGADLSDADLSDADLRGAELHGADLTGANLSRIDLRFVLPHGADLTGANLRDTDLREVNLSGMRICHANLTRADLRGADLSGADLSDTDLHDADLRQASLIDSRLDGANLTGTKLWETQRDGWSIKDVTCQQVFWDRDGKESAEYGVGDFERIFAERPRIVLRYPGGISPVELAMLPLIIERLQAEHPDCVLHIRSVQDDGSGATVTVTVDDLTGRKDDALNRELVRLQAKLEYALEDRDYYRQIFSELFSTIKDGIRLPSQQIHLHRPSGLVTIEGPPMSRDTYNIPGQAGSVGPHSQAHQMTFQQIQSSLDLPKLAEELGRLRDVMKKESEGTREQDKAVAAVAEAEEAASKGDGSTALQHLKTAGKWTLGIAEKIGVTVAAEALKTAM